MKLVFFFDKKSLMGYKVQSEVRCGGIVTSCKNSVQLHWGLTSFSAICFQVVPSGENNINKDDEMKWMIMPEVVSLINTLTIHWLQWMKYWYVIKYEWYVAGSFYHVISLAFLNKETNIMHIQSCVFSEFDCFAMCKCCLLTIWKPV